MKRIFLFLVLIVNNVFAHENHVLVERYIDEAKGYNTQAVSNIDENKVRTLVNDYGKPAKEADYPEKELVSRAEAKLLEDRRKADNKNLTEVERAQSAGFILVGESYIKRKKFDKIDQENWLKKSELIVANSFIGIESACKMSSSENNQVEFKKEAYEVEVSDIREVESEKVCEEDSLEYYKCDNVLKVRCKNQGECDSGGIVLKSLASDMKWVYNYPYLTLGTIADNYWTSSCGSFVRITKFEVRNKNLIDEFKIENVGYDDYLKIMLNGSLVYNGPYGGEKLEIKEIQQGPFKRKRVDLGSSGIHSCELNTNWNYRVDIDLKPYLKEGMNELEMEVVVAGAGEGWAKIKTKQHCCREWEEWWEEKCD